MNDLKQKSIIAIIWNLTERFSTKMIQLIAGIIIARLLLPEDYGLVAMASVFISVSTIFVSGGFGLAYIQKKEVSVYDSNTVFYTNVIVSIIMYITLWLSAPFISKFYGYPSLTFIIRLMSLSIFFNAFSSIQRAVLKREIDFKSLSTANLIGVTFSSLIGIIAANSNMGLYSLIFQQLIGSFLNTTILWFKSNWRPRWIFSIESFKSLFNFGGWLFLSTLLNKIFDNIYKLFIGKFYPAQDLGFYDKAKNYQLISTNFFVGAFGSVSFPVLSSLNTKPNKIRLVIKKFFIYSFAATFPVIVTIWVISYDFIIFFLTKKWEPVIPFLRFLCIVGIFLPINKINAQSILAFGKSKIETFINIGTNILRLASIILTYKYGILYMIIGEIFVSILTWFMFSFFSKKFIFYGISDQIIDIIKFLFIGLLAGLLAFWVKQFFHEHWLRLLISVIIIPSIYLFGIRIFDKDLFNDLLKIKSNFKTN